MRTVYERTICKLYAIHDSAGNRQILARSWCNLCCTVHLLNIFVVNSIMTDTPKTGKNKKAVARQLHYWVEQPPLLMQCNAMISDW